MTEVAVGNGTPTWQHTNVTANGTLIATYDTVGLHFYLNDRSGLPPRPDRSLGLPGAQSLPFGDQLYCTGSLTSPTYNGCLSLLWARRSIENRPSAEDELLPELDPEGFTLNRKRWPR
jgi:hypothetical protein